MKQIKILWTDDEIDLLKPHILFLEEKGYVLETAYNGDDALEKISQTDFDLVFLDENMPGLSGLEVLTRIKKLRPSLPVVMITKSEEEDIMEAAIGSKISDYLIKPVNPNQILLSIKKNIDTKRLVARETTMGYQTDFGKIGLEIMDARSADDWKIIFKKLTQWDLDLQNSGEGAMDEVLHMQKSDANNAFCKFIAKNYTQWFSNDADRPLISPNVLKNKVFPHLQNGEKVVLLMIDNLRYDQYMTIAGALGEYFKVVDDDMYYSILPTVTQYARNAFFAGLMPADIKQIYPDYWLDDEDEGGKNEFEKDLLLGHMKRAGMDYKMHFEKITNPKAGKRLAENISSHLENDLTVVVYNFVDLMSHARTDMEVLKELASDEAAYCSLTLSWFKHSELFDIIKGLANKNIKLIITADHGSVRVQNAVKVIGDRNSSTNLRYKHGKNLGYNPKEVFVIKNPKEARLPVSNITSSYIFAKAYDYLVYPKNYNHFVNMYKNTFQHGGISLEEILIPLITLEPK